MTGGGHGVPFALRLAWREGRSGVRRLGVYMGAITLGVAALVALHSFRADIARAIHAEARDLLGGDARLSSGQPFPEPVAAVVDSLVASGSAAARVTTLPSMVLATRSGTARLLQVRALDGAYPLYGTLAVEPTDALERFRSGRGGGGALVDPAVLVHLDARVGDTLAVGYASFPILGTVADLPLELGFQTAIGPRVFIPGERLESTGLVTFGSLVRYQVFLRLPEGTDAATLEDRYRPVFRTHQVRFVTAAEQAEDLTDSVRVLGRFLGLVGLAALLLGGVGVASAVHVYVQGRLPAVAVLRCLGADQRTVFSAYLLQAGGLSLAGAVAGAVLGVLAQLVLPLALAGLLPVEVTPRPAPGAIVAGLVVGTWVGVAFALLPLLAVRNVPPLAALRRDVEPPRRRRDPARWAAWAALLASLLGVSLLEAPAPGPGLAFAAGAAATAALLWATGWLLARTARRHPAARARFAVRQGIANLHRPRNQTVAVTLALGFGAFAVGTVTQVEANLAERFSLRGGQAGDANLLLFDIQPDQLAGVRELMERYAARPADPVPIVPARVAAINGRSAGDLLADTTGARPSGWALRREYRHTYRAELGPAETVVGGRWWNGDDGPDPGSPARISLEADLAEDLRVGIGDRIRWTLAGTDVETEVASLRRVDWARFEPNFFVVFEPGTLDDAPQTAVLLTRIADGGDRAAFQADLVRALPNVSALDLSRLQEALDGILRRVRLALRFLALFAAAAGLFVLAGAVATSRRQRVLEGALLRTLGARGGLVMRTFGVEYLALGAMGALSGGLLSTVAAWLVVARLFDAPFRVHPAPFVGVLGLVVLLSAAVGVLGSRGTLKAPPLAVLRNLG